MRSLCKVLAASAVLVFLVPPLGWGDAQSVPRAPIHIVVDGDAPAHAFPHFWEQMFGSGRAVLSLRASYRDDMRAVKAATDFRYVRFHGILDRDVGIYTVDAQGRPDYNFTYIDQIYDGLLRQGVRPFVELSFMPPDMASRQQEHGLLVPPHRGTAQGLVAVERSDAAFRPAPGGTLRHRRGLRNGTSRSGTSRTAPSGAAIREQATYFQLYDLTARALKSVSPRLRVGGPATAQAAWVPAFISTVRRAMYRWISFRPTSTATTPPHNVFGDG